MQFSREDLDRACALAANMFKDYLYTETDKAFFYDYGQTESVNLLEKFGVGYIEEAFERRADQVKEWLGEKWKDVLILAFNICKTKDLGDGQTRIYASSEKMRQFKMITGLKEIPTGSESYMYNESEFTDDYAFVKASFFINFESGGLIERFKKLSNADKFTFMSSFFSLGETIDKLLRNKDGGHLTEELKIFFYKNTLSKCAELEKLSVKKMTKQQALKYSKDTGIPYDMVLFFNAIERAKGKGSSITYKFETYFDKLETSEENWRWLINFIVGDRILVEGADDKIIREAPKEVREYCASARALSYSETTTMKDYLFDELSLGNKLYVFKKYIKFFSKGYEKSDLEQKIKSFVNDPENEGDIAICVEEFTKQKDDRVKTFFKLFPYHPIGKYPTLREEYLSYSPDAELVADDYKYVKKMYTNENSVKKIIELLGGLEEFVTKCCEIDITATLQSIRNIRDTKMIYENKEVFELLKDATDSPYMKKALEDRIYEAVSKESELKMDNYELYEKRTADTFLDANLPQGLTEQEFAKYMKRVEGYDFGQFLNNIEWILANMDSYKIEKETQKELVIRKLFKEDDNE